jgi:hypothetical protein
MRRLAFSLALVFALVSWPSAASVADLHLPFYVFHGFHSPDNHFVPSGWMGDYRDIRYDDHYRDPGIKTHTVIRIRYAAKGAQGNGWAGIYWQNTPNNWGNHRGGFNLNGAHRVRFRGRGGRGGEIVSQFKVGGITGNYADSGSAAIGPITLTKEWKEYDIALDGEELSSIIGGFCWTMTRDQNPAGATFYLDDIRYE